MQKSLQYLIYRNVNIAAAAAAASRFVHGGKPIPFSNNLILFLIDLNILPKNSVCCKN